MNRSLWKESLNETWCPPWPCPVCRKGTLALIPKSLTSEETVQSKRAQKGEYWDPFDSEYTFTAWAECKHPSCQQRFAISGIGGVVEDSDENDAPFLRPDFQPKTCHPMPDIFEFPAKCPGEVKEELRAAFEVFWANPAACAGRIRVALECLMTHLGVPKRKKDGNGRYSDLKLHARIDSYSRSDPQSGPQLIALKWLGNAGSHNRKVSQDDLLDALEILEHALAEIIDRRSARVTALAKQLTKKHGR